MSAPPTASRRQHGAITVLIKPIIGCREVHSTDESTDTQTVPHEAPDTFPLVMSRSHNLRLGKNRYRKTYNKCRVRNKCQVSNLNALIPLRHVALGKSV